MYFFFVKIKLISVWVAFPKFTPLGKCCCLTLVGETTFLHRHLGQVYYDVMALPIAWHYHRQRWYGVVLCTTKMTLKLGFWWKIKGVLGENNQKTHCRRDKGIPYSRPWFATSRTLQALWIANHGHSDWIHLSLPQCGDRFYLSCNCSSFLLIVSLLGILSKI